MKNNLTIKYFRIFYPALCFLFLFCFENSFSQNAAIRKADSYFDNNEFTKAIPLYKKASSKDDDALRKLADCYRILKNYEKAELYYGKLVEKKSSDPRVYYYYGAVLLAENKYDDAKKQFSIYSVLSPEDNKGEIFAKVCDRAKDLSGKPALYKVYNLGEINSETADFSPVFYNDGIVFSSERIKDLVNFSSSSSTGNAFSSIVFSKGEKVKDSVVYESAKLFSEKFSADGAYGPACFNADVTEIYFMKVDSKPEKKNGVSQPKIYCSKYKNGWSTPELLPFNSDEFATGHPSLSKDGQFLYFTSNRPGGFGGTDIWVSKRKGDTWSIPQNLGKEINTTEDEAYPYISSSNVLYFSSKGHAGFGGLDIFASSQKSPPDEKSGGTWTSPSNLMPPINSTANDFGVIFKDDNSGFFSSNRAGGKGSDDLYGFSLSGLITSVSGKILLSMNTADAAVNVKVFLLTNKGVTLRTSVTDTTGLFKFDNLPSDQSYMVKVDEKNPIFINHPKIYLTDERDKVVRVAGKNKDGYFIFENLPADLNRLTEIEAEDVSIAGNFYAGDERTPLKNVKVNLVNDKGEIVQHVTTTSYGSFVFMHLASDQKFTLALEALDPKYASKKIYFTNRNGKEIAVCNGRSCEFKILPSDENTMSLLKVEDTQLLVDLEGSLFADKNRKKPLNKISVFLLDEKGKIVGTYETDALGNFKFSNLPADKTYLIKLNENDRSISSKNIFMADGKGKIVATLRQGGKFFRYSFLPAEEQSLAKIYFNDPWLDAEKFTVLTKDRQITIIENIYYDYQKWNLSSQAIITLNKVAEIMQGNPNISIELIAHTDSRGTSEFNMDLSQKRAQTAVDYIISKGIDKNRLVAKGVGETQLVNRCKDGVDCSEEEHAQNRRTEFRVKKISH